MKKFIAFAVLVSLLSCEYIGCSGYKYEQGSLPDKPIQFEEDVDYYKDMMVFSSNRTGGKGGFDLYFVGVERTD